MLHNKYMRFIMSKQLMNIALRDKIRPSSKTPVAQGLLEGQRFFLFLTALTQSL